MKKTTIYFSLLLVWAPASFAQLKYPETKKVNQQDEYFGVKVADPYRWFENDSSAEVKSWIQEQNKVSKAYLSQIPFRQKIIDRVKEANNIPLHGRPHKVGEYYFYYYNTGLQPQEDLFIQKGLTGKPHLFMDVNSLSADGTTRVTLLDHSEDNKYIAVKTRKAGSDWIDINIFEVATGYKLPDEIKWVKISGATWKGNGFFYTKYEEPSAATMLTSRNENPRIFYHRLGTQQQADQLIYEDKNPLSFNQSLITEDKRFFIVTSFSGKNNTNIYYRDYNSSDSTLKLLIKGVDNEENSIITNDGGRLLIMTNHNAPNNMIVSIDPASPSPANWKTIIPEKTELLSNVFALGGKLVLEYLKDVTSRCNQYSYKGHFEREIKFPVPGTLNGFSGEVKDSIAFYVFSSFTYPYTIYKYNVNSGTSELYNKIKMKNDPADYEVKQVFYQSKDRTKIPMFLVYKKGLLKDGNHPTLLYAYGGYSAISNPNFEPGLFTLLDAGGVYAVANIRGGGEYGEKWHQAGMLLNTQNRFDDFIAAAEYLIKEKYTSPQKLGIWGASHGGNLVATAELQRPELFKVAVPQFGTLDMLRFNKFTVGWNWVREYGNPDSIREFKNLLAYSPVHNVKKGIEYPATLVMTADHDDRVVPMHSFKFISELQAKQAGLNPVIIRVDTNSGHGGSSFIKYLEDYADVLSFLLYNTNSKVE